MDYSHLGKLHHWSSVLKFTTWHIGDVPWDQRGGLNAERTAQPEDKVRQGVCIVLTILANYRRIFSIHYFDSPEAGQLAELRQS